MKNMVSTLAIALALLGAGAAGSISLAQPSFAQAEPASPPEPGAGGPEHHRGEMHEWDMREKLPGRHIEGRLAFLRTELKITDAQGPTWDKYAAAVRDHATKADAMIEQMHKKNGGEGDLIRHMEDRAKLAELEANAKRSEVEAFKPLYATFSDEQKKTAAELFGRWHHHMQREHEE